MFQQVNAMLKIVLTNPLLAPSYGWGQYLLEVYMEIAIYTDNLQAGLRAGTLERLPDGLGRRAVVGAFSGKQVDEDYPAVRLLGSAKQDLFKSGMLVHEVQLHNPLGFRDELLSSGEIQIVMGLDYQDYEFLLYNFTGKSIKGLFHRDMPGQFWKGAANE